LRISKNQSEKCCEIAPKTFKKWDFMTKTGILLQISELAAIASILPSIVRVRGWGRRRSALHPTCWPQAASLDSRQYSIENRSRGVYMHHHSMIKAKSSDWFNLSGKSCYQKIKNKAAIKRSLGQASILGLLGYGPSTLPTASPSATPF
jgi:hypothetical protein